MEINASLFYLGGGTVRNFTGKVGVLKNGRKIWGETFLPLLVGIDLEEIIKKAD
jgi:hypothetical protein